MSEATVIARFEHKLSNLCKLQIVWFNCSCQFSSGFVNKLFSYGLFPFLFTVFFLFIQLSKNFKFPFTCISFIFSCCCFITICFCNATASYICWSSRYAWYSQYASLAADTRSQVTEILATEPKILSFLHYSLRNFRTPPKLQDSFKFQKKFKIIFQISGISGFSEQLGPLQQAKKCYSKSNSNYALITLQHCNDITL